MVSPSGEEGVESREWRVESREWRVEKSRIATAVRASRPGFDWSAKESRRCAADGGGKLGMRLVELQCGGA
jgi:hypothetical protein